LAIHTFDTEIVKRVGFPAAVLYQNIVFWAAHNMHNGRHFYEGRWWTFNSRKAFSDQFDYMSEDQIRYAIKKLVDAGLVKTGRFNKKGYDKTTWYSPDVSDEWTLGENSPMDRGKFPNGSGKIPQPIPDSKPDDKPDKLDSCAFPEFGSMVSSPPPSRRNRSTDAYTEALQRALNSANRSQQNEEELF